MDVEIKRNVMEMFLNFISIFTLIEKWQELMLLEKHLTQIWI